MSYIIFFMPLTWCRSQDSCTTLWTYLFASSEHNLSFFPPIFPIKSKLSCVEAWLDLGVSFQVRIFHRRYCMLSSEPDKEWQVNAVQTLFQLCLPWPSASEVSAHPVHSVWVKLMVFTSSHSTVLLWPTSWKLEVGHRETRSREDRAIPCLTIPHQSNA